MDDDQRARLVIIINETVNKLVVGRKRGEHQIGHKNHANVLRPRDDVETILEDERSTFCYDFELV